MHFECIQLFSYGFRDGTEHVSSENNVRCISGREVPFTRESVFVKIIIKSHGGIFKGAGEGYEKGNVSCAYGR